MPTAQHSFRTNRPCIINLEFITELGKAGSGTVLLEDGAGIAIVPSRKHELPQNCRFAAA